MAAAPKPDRFQQALRAVLVHEGGKVNHPQDPGGKTNKGVTQRVYNGWLAKNDRAPKDVFKITVAEVEAIYRFQFWDVIHGDELPPGVGFVVFDGGVNSGTKQSVKWLQRAIGMTPNEVDGVLGAITLGRVQDFQDHDKLIAAIIDRREIFLRNLKTFRTFGKGWLRRINAVEMAGQAWAAGSVPPNPKFIDDANHKAYIDDAKTAPPKAPGDIGIGAGATSGGLGAILANAQAQLLPFQTLGWVKTGIVWIIIVGAVTAAVSALYRFYATRQIAKLEDAMDLKIQ